MTAVEAPAGARPALRSVRVRSALLAGAAIAALAALLRLALGPGQVNYDSLYALVWGRELAHGHAPDYTGGVLPPTPHPLSTLTGALLSPLGTHADRGLLVLAFAGLGALGWLAFATGRRLAGAGAGIAAAVLVLTRDTTLFYGGLAYFDIAFAVLVVAALLVELRRPRAGVPVLALLAVAGLWRPEAWVLSGAYALYVMRATPSWRARGILALWACAAPALWLASDLVLAGDPLFSLTYTQQAADTLHRQSGPSAAVHELPRALGQVVRPAAAIGALAGLVLALVYARRRAALLVATVVVSGAGTAAAVAAGTPLNARYLLLPAVLCLLLCALALGGWTQLPRGRGRLVWQVVAAGVALLLVASAPGEVTRLRGVHERVAFQAAVARDARATAQAAGCDRLTVEGGRPVPLLALALDRPATEFAVARNRAPRSGLVLAPADGRVVRDYLLVRRAPQPAGLALTASSEHWRLYGHCPARG